MRQRITNTDKRPVGMGISGCERASEFAGLTATVGMYHTALYSRRGGSG
jgi:hypothetical protein